MLITLQCHQHTTFSQQGAKELNQTKNIQKKQKNVARGSKRDCSKVCTYVGKEKNKKGERNAALEEKSKTTEMSDREDCTTVQAQNHGQ